MEKKISFKLESYDDKEKMVSALTNSGYIVGAELEKDKNTGKLYGWRVDVYVKSNPLTDDKKVKLKNFINGFKNESKVDTLNLIEEEYEKQ